MRRQIVHFIFGFFFAIGLIAQAEPLRITSPEFGDAKQPQIAANDKGAIAVAFGNARGIWFTSSHDNGKTFSSPKIVSEVKGLALGMRRGPRIVINGDLVTVAAISHVSGNLLSWTSSDAGATWSNEKVINKVSSSAREGMHSLSGDGRGNVFALWLDLREKKTQLWGSKSTDGGKSWGKNIRIYKSPDETICECCHPSVAFGPKGEVVAMWRNWLGGSRDLYRSISTDGGETFGEAVKLGTGTWPLKGCPMDGGSLAVTGDKIAYVWRRELKVFVTTKNESETLITESGKHPIILPGANGDFQFIWQGNDGLYRKGHGQPNATLFAKDGEYASAAWMPASKRAFVVWEGVSGETRSIFFDSIE